MSCLLTVVAFQSFSLLPLGLVVALRVSSSLSLVFRTFLGVVDFHSIRIATSLTSSLAVSSVARSSDILIMFLFYGSFVEFVVDFDRCFYQVEQGRLIGSITHKLVLNVILQSAVVHSAQGVVVPTSSRCVFRELSSVLGRRCLLSNVLDLSNRDLLIVANSVDALYLRDKRSETCKDSLRVIVA